MSNDAVLMQHVYGGTNYTNLLKVTAGRNLDYCLAHKFDFEMVVNDEMVPDTGDWAKIHMIRAAMEAPYKFIVYLDPDTVIADLTADLRDGCPPDKIGVCRHVLTNPPYNMYLDHLNVGALYVSNCEATKAFIDKWLAGYPGTKEPPWYEQGVMNKINDGTVVEIDAKWNATGQVNPSPNPVVLGFHGQGKDVLDRFNMMCKAIGK
jgi:hypothetical protein